MSGLDCVEDALLTTLRSRPDSTLINGLGRAQNSSVASELAVINVKKGSRSVVMDSSRISIVPFTKLAFNRYRFRLVSISCDPNFIFAIDGHNMTVIEADGVNTQPKLVDSIQIFAGQRYSFVVSDLPRIASSTFYSRVIISLMPTKKKQIIGSAHVPTSALTQPLLTARTLPF